MIIYRITNKLSGKSYIGQTIKLLEQRWSEHCGKKAKCKYLHAALQKYGKENFFVEEIARYSNLEDLNNAEEYYIDFYNCLAPNGYNLRSGGGNGGALHEETKKLLSELNTGSSNPNFGLKRSQETKNKIAAGNKGKKRTSEMNQVQSKLRSNIPLSEEHKQKISRATKGKKKSLAMRTKLSASKMGAKHPYFGKPAHNRLSVQCVETGIIYSSQREAAKALKYSESGITRALDKGYAVKGFHFVRISSGR